MRVAIDFDDTIANRDEAVHRFLAYEGLNADEIRHSKKGLSLTSPFPDAISTLNQIHSLGYELSIVSATTPERLVWIKDWLISKDIMRYFDGVYISDYGDNGPKKEAVCQNIGASFLVDNELRHFTFENGSLSRILYDPLDESRNNCPTGVCVARSWRDVYQYLHS